MPSKAGFVDVTYTIFAKSLRIHSFVVNFVKAVHLSAEVIIHSIDSCIC